MKLGMLMLLLGFDDISQGPSGSGLFPAPVGFLSEVLETRKLHVFHQLAILHFVVFSSQLCLFIIHFEVRELQGGVGWVFHLFDYEVPD